VEKASDIELLRVKKMGLELKELLKSCTFLVTKKSQFVSSEQIFSQLLKIITSKEYKKFEHVKSPHANVFFKCVLSLLVSHTAGLQHSWLRT